MDTIMMARMVAGIVVLVMLLIVLPPYWMIFKKAGFSPWICLLMIVPLVNIVALYVVAFSQWKVVPAPTTLPHQTAQM